MRFTSKNKFERHLFSIGNWCYEPMCVTNGAPDMVNPNLGARVWGTVFISTKITSTTKCRCRNASHQSVTLGYRLRISTAASSLRICSQIHMHHWLLSWMICRTQMSRLGAEERRQIGEQIGEKARAILHCTGNEKKTQRPLGDDLLCMLEMGHYCPECPQEKEETGTTSAYNPRQIKARRCAQIFRPCRDVLKCSPPY